MPVALHSSGLGSLGAACGDNPCGWFDQVYMSDACLSYNKCANPTAWETLVVDKGFIWGTGIAAENEFLSGAKDAATNLWKNPLDGTIDWTKVGIVAIAAIVGFKLLMATGQVAGEYYVRRRG